MSKQDALSVGGQVILVGVVSPELVAGSPAMGSITLQWGRASPKIKSYGFSSSMRLDSGQTILLHTSLGTLPGVKHQAPWRELEGKDFAREFLREAPGPHVTVEVSSHLLHAGERVAVLAKVMSLRFSGEDNELRDNAQQEIDEIEAELIITGDNAEERLRERLAEIEAEKQREAQKRARRESSQKALRSPMQTLRRNAGAIVLALLFLLGASLFLLGTYTVWELPGNDSAVGPVMAIWGVGLCSLSVFLWFWRTAPLPSWIEDGNELASWGAGALAVAKAYHNGKIPTLRELQVSPYVGAVRLHAPTNSGLYISTAAPIVVVGVFVFFALFFLLLSLGSLNKGLVIGFQGWSWVLMIGFLLLWVLLYLKRVKRALFLLRTPPSLFDGSWGSVEGVVQSAKFETLTMTLSNQKRYEVKFAGADWTSARRGEMNILLEALKPVRHVWLVGRAGASEMVARGQESLFVYIAESSARADLRSRVASWLTAVMFLFASLLMLFALMY